MPSIISRLLIFLCISQSILAETDYTCVNHCTDQDYGFSFCKEKCSYDKTEASKDSVKQETSKPQHDYTCVSRCTADGYGFAYCQDKCSY